MSFFKETQHLNRPFRDIEHGTKKFATLIGKGGYGNVYRGELSFSSKLTDVAVKRLEIYLSGQGLKEFLTEIHLLSRYKHPNLISLLGYCEEHDEKILIYEYAEGGSLDKYLKASNKTTILTWKQRINICIDAARGLDYLHNRVAENLRIIHRDIKSANILLDHNLKAKIADFGLSKIGGAYECDAYLITDPSGTFGYCDPAYMDSGILTKESDVYSFGVVMFEILCGRLCFVNVNNEQRFLAPLAQRCYEESRLTEIIDPELKQHMDSESLKKFSETAYQCLQDERKLRPSMGLVVQKLTEALELLEVVEKRRMKLKKLEERRMQVTSNEVVGKWRMEVTSNEVVEKWKMLVISNVMKEVVEKWRMNLQKLEERRMQVTSNLQTLEERRMQEVVEKWRMNLKKLEERRMQVTSNLMKEVVGKWRMDVPSNVIKEVVKWIMERIMEVTSNVMKEVEEKRIMKLNICGKLPMTSGTMKKQYSQICDEYYFSEEEEKWFWSNWLKSKTWNKNVVAERMMKTYQKTTKNQEQRRIKNMSRGKWKHY